VSRSFPALDVAWGPRPDDEAVERMLAEIDDERPTAWEARADGVRIFFTSTDDRRRAAIRLTGFESGLTCTPVNVPDEEWAERSQASLDPVRVAGIVVSPPWRADDATRLASEATPPARVVLIQPSMGFGTGHHATTRLCLDLLQRRDLTGARVLDIGTGSAVLAIAAWRLGARDVDAADRDADALQSAAENIALNGAEGAVRLRLVDLDAGDDALGPPGRFDLVLANLTGATLDRFAGLLARLVSPGGALIVSGFEAHEEAGVRQAFEAVRAVPVDRAEEHGWIALRLTIPSGSTAS